MDENIDRFFDNFPGYEKYGGTWNFPSPTIDGSKKNAGKPKKRGYLEGGNNLFETFHFLLGHLIIHQPADPIQYLYDLLDDCILFRSGLKEPRLLWTEGHVEVVFENLIRSSDSDLLSLNDYQTAMKILGVRSYDPCPVERVPGYIDRPTFCKEALNSMKQELLRIVKTPA